MKLQYSGAPLISAPLATVWQRLMDPHFVCASAPKVDAIEVTDPTRYRVVSNFGAGPWQMRFTLDIHVTDIVPERSGTMLARGEAPGTVLDVRSHVRLEPVAEAETLLRWDAEVAVQGPLAMGGPLVEGAGRLLTEEFWKDFAKRAGEAT